MARPQTLPTLIHRRIRKHKLNYKPVCATCKIPINIGDEYFTFRRAHYDWYCKDCITKHPDYARDIIVFYEGNLQKPYRGDGGSDSITEGDRLD